MAQVESPSKRTVPLYTLARRKTGTTDMATQKKNDPGGINHGRLSRLADFSGYEIQVSDCKGLR